MDKPRICEVLGVDVGEKFSVNESEVQWYVSTAGFVVTDDERSFFSTNIMSDSLLMQIINHPDRVIRESQFSEDEKAVLRLLKNAGFVKLMPWDVSICAKKIHEERTYFTKDLLPSYKMDYEIDLNKINLE